MEPGMFLVSDVHSFPDHNFTDVLTDRLMTGTGEEILRG
jgi:hypothetical protein